MSPDNKNTPHSGAVFRVLKVVESCVSIILGRVKCLSATFPARTLYVGRCIQLCALNQGYNDVICASMQTCHWLLDFESF